MNKFLRDIAEFAAGAVFFGTPFLMLVIEFLK